MGFLRFIVWTGASVGLGIGLATVDVAGRTTLEHLQRLWATERPHLTRDLRSTVDEVKKRTMGASSKVPSEQHSASDRSAIDDIIAKRPRP